MQIKTRGIVLQSTDYSESSLVVKVYTEESGMASFIVSGVRARQPRFPVSLFQPFSLVEMVASGKPGTSMLRITDIRLSPPLTGIAGNMLKSSVALFLAEVVYRSVKEETPNQTLFGFLHNSIQVLDIGETDCSKFHLYFLARLTRLLGFSPNGEFTEGVSIFDLREGLFRNEPPAYREYLSHGATRKLNLLMRASFENYSDIDVNYGEMKELLKGLVFYYELHQTHGHAIRSHQVLVAILN
jgi:DNA repair protein RecO (recombination protein O)